MRTNELSHYLDQPVILKGWVHRVRKQGKKLIFIVLRDGAGLSQVCIGSECLQKCGVEYGDQIQKESYLHIEGVVAKDDRSPYYGVEVRCNRFEIVGESSGIDEINRESKTYVKLEQRHLVLRDEKLTNIMKVRSSVMYFLSEWMRTNDVYKVTPPTLTQQEVEGGSTLFELDYYGEKAVLTQSSQLYLETCIPSLERVWCELPSFRNEKSATRRHLSEFTHIEAELGSIEFDDLLNFIENLVVDTANYAFGDKKTAGMIDTLARDSGKKTAPLKKPFMRMRYSDGIKWLQDHDVQLSLGDGKKRRFEYGDDIPEGPERYMVDSFGEPIFLTHFPRKMKAFYMQPALDNPEETLSVDLLLPNVGEVVGGSMRITDLKTLEEGFDRHGLDKDKYRWYIDQRVYGSAPHGGFGFGTERFLMWLMMLDSVKDCCLYPRYMGRIQP